MSFAENATHRRQMSKTRMGDSKAIRPLIFCQTLKLIQPYSANFKSKQEIKYDAILAVMYRKSGNVLLYLRSMYSFLN